MSQLPEPDHDVEANFTSYRNSETPTVVNSVRYSNASTADVSQTKRHSEVPDVPAVPTNYTRRNSQTRSFKTDDGTATPGEKDEAQDELPTSANATTPVSHPTEERNDLVDWEGPNDPENPQNMPQWKKWMITWLLAFLNVWVTFSSTIFASAVTTTSHEYNVSRVVMTLGVSLTVLVRLHRGREFSVARRANSLNRALP